MCPLKSEQRTNCILKRKGKVQIYRAIIYVYNYILIDHLRNFLIDYILRRGVFL